MRVNDWQKATYDHGWLDSNAIYENIQMLDCVLGAVRVSGLGWWVTK